MKTGLKSDLDRARNEAVVSALLLMVWIESGVISEDFSKSAVEADEVLGGSIISEDLKPAESRVSSIITRVEEV